MKQEGYQIPTKLPLNKTEEKILKKIRRKIKNKVTKKIKAKKFHFINFSFLFRYQLKKVVERKKNMLIHLNDKLPNILMKMEHLKNVYQRWKKTKGEYIKKPIFNINIKIYFNVYKKIMYLT
jgi:hypothetical protein